jgi:hypothetical protein
MAEESKSKRMTFEDSMFMLFAIMLAANALQRLPLIAQEQLGIDIGATHLVASASLGQDTPLGTPVSTPNGTPYYKEPNTSAPPEGTFPPGASLFLSDGPKVSAFGGGRYWYVEDTETGAIGWVPENALVREGAGGVSADTKRGAKVRALLNTSVWDVPGASTPLSAVKKGERGTIGDGPLEYARARWWFFDRSDTEADGWVPETALVMSSDTSWREGSRVRAVQPTDLFERAGGGSVVGSLAEDEQAKVAGGPVNVGESYWWLVASTEGMQGWVAESALEDGGVKGWVKGVLAAMLIIGAVLTLVLLGGIVYATIRTNQVRAKESQRIKNAIPKTMQPKRNDRWDTVLTHVSSENPNDWRLAIIEADVMLDELVMRMGYMGTTLGERMKQIAKGDMRTLDAAWEAHRVRNQVAHAGSDFILTKREAKRVIDLYGAVFAEFKFI